MYEVLYVRSNTHLDFERHNQLTHPDICRYFWEHGAALEIRLKIVSTNCVCKLRQYAYPMGYRKFSLGVKGLRALV